MRFGGAIGGFTPSHERMNASTPISSSDLARIFGLSMVRAHAWLRQLPHVKVGRARYTRAEWLAQWEAAHLKNPPVVKCFDPLEAAVAERAAWAVGELVRQGKIAVLPGAPEPSTPNSPPD